MTRAVSYFHKPTGQAFLVVGATTTGSGLRAFVVCTAEDVRERMFLLDFDGKLAFDAPRVELEALWLTLASKEEKRVKAKTRNNKRQIRPRLNAVEADEAQEQSEKEERWSRISSEYTPDVFEADENAAVINDELAAEWQTIGEDD